METLAKALTSTMAMAAVLLIAAHTPLARAQGCPVPPENQPFSTFQEWKAVCSKYGTPHGTTLQNAHCDYDPNWCHRNETSRPPTQARNNDDAEREAAIAREKAAEAERLRRIAEEKRRQQEFQEEKAQALRSLKGVSADDLGLKGGSPDDLGLKHVDTGAAKGGSTSSLDLKDVRATPIASGPSEINRIYWRTVSVPAACVVAGELKAGDACIVVYHLLKVLRGPNATQEFEKSVLEEALRKAIVISLGQGQENLDRKIDLVKALYQAEAQVFDEIERRIDAELAEDPAKQALLEQTAKLDNEAVKGLKREIYAEKEANVQASIDYLRRNPRTKGIRFDCTTACQQLIQAARGMNVFE